MTEPIQINIYSDGGYFEKQNIGGWGSVIYKQGQELSRLSDWQKHTSSLEMELKAAAKALEAVEQIIDQQIKPDCQITLHTDSRILIEGLTQKIHLWRKNAWVHKSGNPVKYQALWESLEKFTLAYQVKWQWVKGHNGNEGNTIADQLAREAVMQRVQANQQ